MKLTPDSLSRAHRAALPASAAATILRCDLRKMLSKTYNRPTTNSTLEYSVPDAAIQNPSAGNSGRKPPVRCSGWTMNISVAELPTSSSA